VYWTSALDIAPPMATRWSFSSREIFSSLLSPTFRTHEALLPPGDGSLLPQYYFLVAILSDIKERILPSGGFVRR